MIVVQGGWAYSPALESIHPINHSQSNLKLLKYCAPAATRALEREAAAHDELFKALLEELMTERLRAPVAEEV